MSNNLLKKNQTIYRLKERAELLQAIRSYFYQKKVLEVETPALSQAANTDPMIASFSTSCQRSTRYLHTSPEYPMKRLLAEGSGDIYQICKVWRNEESGQKHNPEFTLLEWYRTQYSYHDLMQEVAQLLQFLFYEQKKKITFLSYEAAFLEFLHINPHSCSDLDLKYCLQNQNIAYPENVNRNEMLDLLMACHIEKQFSSQCFTFIYDYPASQRALSRLKPSNLKLAERFEVYLGDIELGNGYQEETDAEENQRLLEYELSLRQIQGKELVPMDKHFIHSLKKGLPKVSGVALGIDRLLMCKMETLSIQDTLSFPWKLA